MNVRMHYYCSKYMWVFYYLAKLNWVIAKLILDPSKNVTLFWYQPCILASKSPNSTIRNGLLFTMYSKLSSKFLMKLSWKEEKKKRKNSWKEKVGCGRRPRKTYMETRWSWSFNCNYGSNDFQVLDNLLTPKYFC